MHFCIPMAVHLGLPKFGPELWFEPQTTEPNLRFEFGPSSVQRSYRKFSSRFGERLVPPNLFEPGLNRKPMEILQPICTLNSLTFGPYHIAE
jgi:hypothetical protein